MPADGDSTQLTQQAAAQQVQGEMQQQLRDALNLLTTPPAANADVHASSSTAQLVQACLPGAAAPGMTMGAAASRSSQAGVQAAVAAALHCSSSPAAHTTPAAAGAPASTTAYPTSLASGSVSMSAPRGPDRELQRLLLAAWTRWYERLEQQQQQQAAGVHGGDGPHRAAVTTLHALAGPERHALLAAWGQLADERPSGSSMDRAMQVG